MAKAHSSNKTYHQHGKEMGAKILKCMFLQWKGKMTHFPI